MKEIPPKHYRDYWKLEDENRELKDLASDLLLYYIQEHVEDSIEKADVITKVANKIGFKVFTTKNPDNDGSWGWGFMDKYSIKMFSKFVEEVRNIRRGNYESEVVQLAEIIMRYKKIPWYKRLFKWLSLI